MKRPFRRTKVEEVGRLRRLCKRSEQQQSCNELDGHCD